MVFWKLNRPTDNKETRLPDPLPSFIASLSKYYRVEDHYKLIASIKYDAPESLIQAPFDRDLYVTGRARYLVIKNGIVIRDKLVNLVHEENHFSERVKMVMYFLFMFRDPRYRRFICEKLGQKNGKWDTAIFDDKHSDTHFERAGGRKAFTNLRQFLFQTQIIDERTLQPHIPPLATWFPDAVEIAAQAIENIAARRSFLASPHGFLIRYKLNALLNATPEELAALEFGGTYEEAEDLLPQIELPAGQSGYAAADFKEWNRKVPLRRTFRKSFIETDSTALERANGQHFALEKYISALFRKRHLKPKTNKHIDLLVEKKAISVVFEMKSCGLNSIRAQLRRAISQLLEYKFIYRDHLGKDVRLCVVLERQPKGRLSWLVDYMESLDIGLIWKNDGDDRMNCNQKAKDLLSDLLPEVLNEDF